MKRIRRKYELTDFSGVFVKQLPSGSKPYAPLIAEYRIGFYVVELPSPFIPCAIPALGLGVANDRGGAVDEDGLAAGLETHDIL